MTRRRRPLGPVTGAGIVALGLVATACSNQDSDPPVTIFGAETNSELQSLQDAFDDFTADTGIQVEVEGSRAFASEIDPLIDGDNRPDIAMFPQPGKLTELARMGKIAPLPHDVVDIVEGRDDESRSAFDETLTDLVTVDGRLRGIPVKADLKSLVWYSPPEFTARGYPNPKDLETFEEFLALARRMRDAGDTPFCVGIEDGPGTGWPLTDWIEDFMLRMEGPELYDEWLNHDIPFDHPDVVRVAETVFDLLLPDGSVFGGSDAAAVTNFQDAGLPLLAGECMMHRQAHFYDTFWPDGTRRGPADGEGDTEDEGIVDAFFLPGTEEQPRIALSGGNYAAAIGDEDDIDADVLEVLTFLAKTDFAEARARNGIGGFLSPNKGVDTNAYPERDGNTGEPRLTRRFAELLQEAEPVRYDASDLMDSAIGSGAFLEAVQDILTGARDVATAFAEVEESWRKLERG